MKRMSLVVAAMMLCGGAATAAAVEPAANEVHASGCVEQGVEAHCLVVKDVKSGTVYNLFFGQSRPAIGAGIEFTGVPHNGMTMCMQGAPVHVTHWARKDSLKCASTEEPGK